MKTCRILQANGNEQPVKTNKQLKCHHKKKKKFHRKTKMMKQKQKDIDKQINSKNKTTFEMNWPTV
jgi:hypothetical protein